MALIAVNEYYALRRHASFTAPFTDRLVTCGAILENRRDTILREDKIAHVMGIALSVTV